jgi:MarR family transcriptional regulator, 2-MHQ and catechol-resistance regulon repressor
MEKQTQPDLSGIHTWLILWKAARAVEAHATRNVELFEMSPTDFGVLEALLHKGPLSVTQLGEKVLLTSGSMTTAIDRLETRSLVTRCNDVNDRRARIIKLTPQGRALIKKVFRQHEQAMEQAIHEVTPQERATLLPLLRMLGKTAQQNF